MSDIRIREAVIGDQDQVISIWKLCELVKPQNDPELDYQLALETKDSAVLVLETENSLIGSVVVGFDGHRGWYYYLGITPDHQSAGNGRLLVEAAENWLISRGAPKAMLMVRNSNSKVIGFYEKLGYSVEETSVLGKRL
jgi:ribosomal protein S18 acetylase RimI-like enzyme